jgi:hypothetical protein
MKACVGQVNHHPRKGADCPFHETGVICEALARVRQASASGQFQQSGDDGRGGCSDTGGAVRRGG